MSDSETARLEAAAARALAEWEREHPFRTDAARAAWLEGYYVAAADGVQPEPARDALRKLEQWDMLSLGSDGRGVACADAPWARALIADALAALSVSRT